MLFLKYIILFFIFFSSLGIGFVISNKYKLRVIELREIKNLLNMLKTKMKFTYEPIPEILEDISSSFQGNILELINIIKLKINIMPAGLAWQEGVDGTYLNLNKEDKQILKKLGNLLGKTDLDGQLAEIEVTESFLNKQIEKAEIEKQKNEKMYKTLGVIFGIGFVIILI